MTIILCTRARKAALAKGSDPAKLARRALSARGLVVTARVLAARSLSECIDAFNWASRGKSVAVRPPFLAELLADGKALQRPGTCQECGCTDAAGCFPGCAWANVAATLCTSCVPKVARAAAAVRRLVRRLAARAALALAADLEGLAFTSGRAAIAPREDMARADVAWRIRQLRDFARTVVREP